MPGIHPPSGLGRPENLALSGASLLGKGQLVTGCIADGYGFTTTGTKLAMACRVCGGRDVELSLDLTDQTHRNCRNSPTGASRISPSAPASATIARSSRSITRSRRRACSATIPTSRGHRRRWSSVAAGPRPGSWSGTASRLGRRHRQQRRHVAAAVRALRPAPLRRRPLSDGAAAPPSTHAGCEQRSASSGFTTLSSIHLRAEPRPASRRCSSDPRMRSRHCPIGWAGPLPTLRRVTQIPGRVPEAAGLRQR